MKEKIEKRIKAHIESIIKKEHLEPADYQTLTAEICRIEAKESAAKWESESEERNEKMAQLMACAFSK